MKKILVCMVSIVIPAVLLACGNVTIEAADTNEADTEAAGTEAAGTEAADTNAADTNVADTNAAVINAADTNAVDINTETDIREDETMKITVGDTVFTAVLADNSSVEALKGLLAEGPLTINMSDYAGMEKVGSIGTILPRNDKQITTEAGDIILYQGSSLVIYYDTNAWSLTRIGKIQDATRAELLEALGDGEVTVTFSLD